MTLDRESEPREEILNDLKVIRRRGVSRVPILEVQFLRQLASAVVPDDSVAAPAKLVETLTQALARMGEFPMKSASFLLGVSKQTRGGSLEVRRTRAGGVFGQTPNSFKRRR